jgi:hypothetical protein
MKYFESSLYVADALVLSAVIISDISAWLAFAQTGFWNSLFSKEPSISAPMEETHALHLDRHLSWSFDESVDPRAIFTKLKVAGKGGFGVVSEIQLMREVDSPYMTAG